MTPLPPVAPLPSREKVLYRVDFSAGKENWHIDLVRPPKAAGNATQCGSVTIWPGKPYVFSYVDKLAVPLPPPGHGALRMTCLVRRPNERISLRLKFLVTFDSLVTEVIPDKANEWCEMVIPIKDFKPKGDKHVDGTPKILPLPGEKIMSLEIKAGLDRPDPGLHLLLIEITETP